MGPPGRGGRPGRPTDPVDRRPPHRHPLLPGRLPELRRKPPGPRRRLASTGVPGRGRLSPGTLPAGPPRPGLATPTGTPGPRGGARRSGGGVASERRGDVRRHAGLGFDRRRVLLHLARLRNRWRAGPVRPDRTGRAVRHRRLPLRGSPPRRHPPAGRRGRRTAHPPPGSGSWWRPGRDHLRAAAGWRCHPRRVPGPVRRRAGPVPEPGVRPPALRPVLVRNDRKAQVHRAQGRRNPPQAPGGAPAPVRRPVRRPGLLLHDGWLDDVELAGLGPGRRSHAGPLRRLALPPGWHPAVRPRGRL